MLLNHGRSGVLSWVSLAPSHILISTHHAPWNWRAIEDLLISFTWQPLEGKVCMFPAMTPAHVSHVISLLCSKNFSLEKRWQRWAGGAKVGALTARFRGALLSKPTTVMRWGDSVGLRIRALKTAFVLLVSSLFICCLFSNDVLVKISFETPKLSQLCKGEQRTGLWCFVRTWTGVPLRKWPVLAPVGWCWEGGERGKQAGLGQGFPVPFPRPPFLL